MSANRLMFAAIAILTLLAGCAENGNPPTPANLSAAPAQSLPDVPASEATVAFEPFIGMPGNRADELSRKIGEHAKKENLKLARRVDQNATYRVRGYMTAVGNESGTTVVYVYDVFRGETRVHRISGQETSKGSRGDPWTGVENDALNNIALRTVVALKSWLSSGSRS